MKARHGARTVIPALMTQKQERTMILMPAGAIQLHTVSKNKKKKPTNFKNDLNQSTHKISRMKTKLSLVSNQNLRMEPWLKVELLPAS
jgi:hypothetical protein